MVKVLDGANVLMISDRGCYYHIKTLGADDAGVQVCYFAICKYDKDPTIYLFSCDVNMRVEGDSTFDSIDDAKECADRWSETPIKWQCLNNIKEQCCGIVGYLPTE